MQLKLCLSSETLRTAISKVEWNMTCGSLVWTHKPPNQQSRLRSEPRSSQERALEQSQDRYRSGVTNYLEVLQAQEARGNR